jgi:RNA polymerase sigma factor for flagellar operon FliA
MVSETVWRRYREGNEPEVRERILEGYLPLVKNVAGRMALGFPRSVELSDLVSTGVIGLIEALSNFDPDRGVKFETYAVPRIRGAILDELRALDWVPRSTRAKSREVEKATAKLENRFGRPPSDQELAEELSVSHSELFHTLGDISCGVVMSLDELISGEEENRQVPRVETIEDPDDNIFTQIEKNELKQFLSGAISSLSEQERLVVALYYFEELTLKEIGEIMQISESRVSQIHTKAVWRLRGMISEKFEDFPCN